MDGCQYLHITEAAWDHLDRLAQRPAQQAWRTIPEVCFKELRESFPKSVMEY